MCTVCDMMSIFKDVKDMHTASQHLSDGYNPTPAALLKVHNQAMQGLFRHFGSGLSW